MNWFTTKLDFMNAYNDLRTYFFKQKKYPEIIMEILSNFFEISVSTIQSTYEDLLSQIVEYKYSPAEVCNYCVMNKTCIEDCLHTLIAK